MIYIKTAEEIRCIRKAGDLLARLFEYIGSKVKIGQSTLEIDQLCHDWMLSHNATPATLNYRGYPKSTCTSINHVVCHGIPKTADKLNNGDIIGIDIALVLDGYYADSCKTFMIGEVSPEAKELVKHTEAALYAGIDALTDSKKLRDVGYAIECYVKHFSYGIVRELGGHGVGKFFHEDPFVPHYFDPDLRTKLKPGMIFTIEPMINIGSYEVFVDSEDNWTVRTIDSSLSAQFEHTVLIKEKGVEIMTIPF